MTRRSGVILLGLVLTACRTSSVEPGLQIVLSGNEGVFLADWRGRRLQPKLLADLGGSVLISEGSASAVDDMIGVIGSPSDTYKHTVYLIERSTGRYRKLLDELPVGAIAIAPNKQSIALLTKDVLVYDFMERRARPVVRDRGYLVVSWGPGGEHLTYDTPDGWIESVNLRTQRIQRLVSGIAPAWSPDGTKLAYRRYHPPEENTVFLYDPARGTSQEFHRRSWWQRQIRGSLFWSPDGRYLSFNVGFDFLGLTLPRCVVVEVASGKIFTVRSDDRYCGPWLAKR